MAKKVELIGWYYAYISEGLGGVETEIGGLYNTNDFMSGIPDVDIEEILENYSRKKIKITVEVIDE